MAAAEDSQWDELGFTYPVPFLAGGQDPPHHGHVTVQKVSVGARPKDSPDPNTAGLPQGTPGQAFPAPPALHIAARGGPPSTAGCSQGTAPSSHWSSSLAGCSDAQDHMSPLTQNCRESSACCSYTALQNQTALEINL